MIRTYSYELWNGKKSIGKYNTVSPLNGKSLHVYEMSTLKQFYSSKPKIIDVPIIYRCILDDGVDYTFRRCLDVRRKSKRQIEIICGPVTL